MNLKNAANFLAQQMPSVDRSNANPIESLSVDDINYLQLYLEKLKNQKQIANVHTNPNAGQNNFQPQLPFNRATDIYDPLGREVPIDWRSYRDSSMTQLNIPLSSEPGSRGSISTRNGKRSQQNMELNQVPTYFNPYEVGPKQNVLPPLYKPTYQGPYDNDPVLLNKMGITECYGRDLSNHIRDVNVESALMQREMTHLPGQKNLSQIEINRFEQLPFDPQNHTHLVWSDNMPRGGYPTRNERVEL